MGWLLSKELKRSLCELNNLSFAILVALIIRLDLFIGDCLNHLDDLFGLSNQTDELLVLRLKKLEKRPNRNVLECGISAGQKSFQVSVDAAIWLCPVLDKY